MTDCLNALIDRLKTGEAAGDFSYTDLVSLLQEENRPSGGKKTIGELVMRSCIDRQSRVLEVGCTNGFSSLEVGRLVRCSVHGIDINPFSVANAKARVERDPTLVGRVEFSVASAASIPFPDEHFDLLIAGNATSFMDDKRKAAQEYLRVLRLNGFLGIAPIWYHTKPSDALLSKLEAVLGFRITPLSKEEWLGFFSSSSFEVYHCSDYSFLPRMMHDIDYHVKQVTDKTHLSALPPAIISQLQRRWAEILSVFEGNLRHCRYSVVLLRKRAEPEEHELFITGA